MRKIALVMAALMLSGCGKVEGFSRRDGAEHNAETISEVTTTTTIKATKTSEITTTNIKEETTTTKKESQKNNSTDSVSEKNTETEKETEAPINESSLEEVPAESENSIVTDVINDLYFNSQYGYVPVEIGFNSGISLAGYDDGIFYEVGESPIEFTIDDERIAKIGIVQGVGVNVLGVSEGETILNAKTPDGRIASINVVVKEAPSTSTTAVLN